MSEDTKKKRPSKLRKLITGKDAPAAPPTMNATPDEPLASPPAKAPRKAKATASAPPAPAAQPKPASNRRPRSAAAETPASRQQDVTEPATAAPAPQPRVQRTSKPRSTSQLKADAPAALESRASQHPSVPSGPFLTDHDIYLFNEGTHRRLYEKMGAHPAVVNGVEGTYFAVWAPAASAVSVIGDFNAWSNDSHRLSHRASSGVWEGFFPDVRTGTKYKYHIVSSHNGYVVDKTDPFGFTAEVAPDTASIAWDLDYQWNDAAWMSSRGERQKLTAPISVYEVHLGSWMRHANGDSFTYRELAPELARHVKRAGFTHVEFLPVMEHPFFGSWGYQCTGYFAPTSRFGTPQDFMYLVDYLHQQEIGVILDWVPSHFPTDEHGLGYFDGTHLFEHADPRQGFHNDWKSFIFNYGRNEVRSFLVSSAMFWLDRYHADGIRVDAVASMLYLDYSRKEGEWIPNRYGGRDNLEAIAFLRQLNEAVYESFPDIQMIAEESTAWPMVSKPTYIGGLGFGLKWDMGWMHDSLQYMANDPVFRKYHHDKLTFRSIYAFSENFMLPLSHDEVVHGKGSLVNKMPGDDWRKFANLRLLFAWMFAQPGKKLIFMGGEIAQWREWNHDSAVDWHLLGDDRHRGILDTLSDLNARYRDLPAMHELDTSGEGYEWIDGSDVENSVIIFLRKSKKDQRVVMCAFNFTPIPRHDYRVGVPRGGYWTEVLNTDAAHLGGSGHGNMGGLEAAPYPSHGRPHSIVLTLPPLGAVFLVSDPGTQEERTTIGDTVEI